MSGRVSPWRCLPGPVLDHREKWKGNNLGDRKTCQPFISSILVYAEGCAVGWAHLVRVRFCFTVKTKADGSFRLENITTGTYTIHAQKEHLYFETVTIKIAPNTPQLADIIATG